MSEPLSRSKLLLVEGKDEVNFFSAFLGHMGLVDVEVRSFEGVDNLGGYLRALRSVSGFDQVVSLGIVRDAGLNSQGALRSVRNSLANAGFPVPRAGLVRADGAPLVVILINPHGGSTGSIEDVCLNAISADPTKECVDRYIQCLSECGVNPSNQAKTRVHAFIASRDRPEVSLGVAAKRGYFPLNHDAFLPVRQLLEML